MADCSYVLQIQWADMEQTSGDRQSFGEDVSTQCVSEVGMKIDDKTVGCGVTVIPDVIRMLKSVCSEQNEAQGRKVCVTYHGLQLPFHRASGITA